MKDYRVALDNFIKSYQKSCCRYMDSQKDTFSGKYFSDWYNQKAVPMLRDIQMHLDGACLDDRLTGFVELYSHYIREAEREADEDLILENLFAVPDRMQCEFAMFGFLHEEAVTLEDEGWKEAVITTWDSLGEPWNPIREPWKHVSCQLLEEPDFYNQVLSF